MVMKKTAIDMAGELFMEKLPAAPVYGVHNPVF
jgi:hypothetical protein